MLIAFDTETDLFRPGYATPQAVCLSLAYQDKDHPAIPAFGTNHLQCFDRRTGLWWSLLDRDGVRKTWPGLLKYAISGEIGLVAHNLQFDLRVLARLCPEAAVDTFEAIDAGTLWCTMLRERLIANAHGVLSDRKMNAIDPWTGKASMYRTGLDACVMRYFGADIRDTKKAQPGQGEPWRKRYVELIDTPLSGWPQAAIDYAVGDSLWVHGIVRAQDKNHPDTLDGWPTRDLEICGWRPSRLKGEHFSVGPTDAGEVRAAFMLSLMGAWGLRTDPEAVSNTIEDWTKRHEAGLAIARDIGFVNTKGKKNMARLRHAVCLGYGATEAECDACEGRGWNPPTGRQRKNQKCKPCNGVGAFSEGGKAPLTDSGAVSTSEAVLRGAIHHAGLQAYADSLKASNWLNKYGPVLRQGVEIPVTYDTRTPMATGRTSVSKPPMQQPPRGDGEIAGFRDCFVPRPGFLYAGADYDQIELRTLAQLHVWWDLDDSMARAFRDGMDPHVLMAVAILNAEGHPVPANCHDTEWSYELAISCKQGCFDPPPDDLPASQYPPGVTS